MDDFAKVSELKFADQVTPVNRGTEPYMAMPDETVSPEPKPPFTERMLELDGKFAASARDVYYLMEGQPFEGDNLAATKYGIDLMTEFNFNFAGPAGIPGESGVSSPGMVVQAATLLASGTEDQAKSFVYMMDQYERLPMFTMKGTGRAVRAMLGDASIYAGLGTLGAGLVARKAGVDTAKLGIRKALMAIGNNPIKATAGFTAAESGLTEKAFIETERKAGYEISPEEEALRLGITTGVGGTVGAGLGVVGKAVAPQVARSVDAAGDAAQRRIAEREADTGVTLGAGVDPTPAIDRMIAKATAPKDDKPGIIAFHGSGADFDEFKLEKIGTGEGAQAYGYGLYFTDSEDIARYYRSAVTGMDRFNQPDLDTQAGGFTEELGFDSIGGTHSLSSADPEYDYYIGELDKFAVNKSENLSENSKTWEFADGSELTLQTEGVMTFDGKPLDSVYTRDVEDRFGVDIKRIAEEAKKMGIRDDVGTLEDDIGMIFSNLGQGIFNKRDAKAAVESLAGPSGPGAPSRYETIYKYFIEPKIDMTRVDYLMNAGQKKGKMYKVGLEPKPEDMLDYDNVVPSDVVDKVMPSIKDKFSVTNLLNDKFGIGYTDPDGNVKNVIGVQFDTKEAAQNLSGLSGELFLKVVERVSGGDKQGAEVLSNAGIPGIKYRAAGSRAASVDDAAAERNYVIFDDKMIKILEKYGIVGPVSIAAMNAVSGDESEADNG